jgi:hypothetical protein
VTVSFFALVGLALFRSAHGVNPVPQPRDVYGRAAKIPEDYLIMFAWLLISFIVFVFALMRRPVAGTAIAPSTKRHGPMALAGRDYRQLGKNRGIKEDLYHVMFSQFRRSIVWSRFAIGQWARASWEQSRRGLCIAN